MRASYDGRAFVQAARSATAGPFPEAAPFVDALLGGFFEGERALGPAERELVIVALLVGTTPGWMLAVHVYVGLMEGLGVEKIASAVHLSAMYRHGVAAYTSAIAIVERTVEILQLAAERGGEAMETAAVLGALRGAWPA